MAEACLSCQPHLRDIAKAGGRGEAKEDICPQASVSASSTKMLGFFFFSILTEKWQHIGRDAELFTLALSTLFSGDAAAPSFSGRDLLPAARLHLVQGTRTSVWG